MLFSKDAEFRIYLIATYAKEATQFLCKVIYAHLLTSMYIVCIIHKIVIHLIIIKIIYVYLPQEGI